MITVHCDHCKTEVTEVAYRVQAIDARRLDSGGCVSTSHLHWNCLPLFGRSTKAELDAVRVSAEEAARTAPTYEEPPF